ncbi:hypothetical protein ACNKHN_22225 [Shigella flexneri]
MFGDNDSGVHCHMSLSKTASTCLLATNTQVCLSRHCTRLRRNQTR